VAPQVQLVTYGITGAAVVAKIGIRYAALVRRDWKAGREAADGDKADYHRRMAIEFEIDGAGFNVSATDWPSVADGDHVELEIRGRLEDLASADPASFRSAYGELLAGNNGDHAIVNVVATIWEEATGCDGEAELAFENLIDIKAIAPLPSWAA
jgi:hypothetical protein